MAIKTRRYARLHFHCEGVHPLETIVVVQYFDILVASVVSYFEVSSSSESDVDLKVCLPEWVLGCRVGDDFHEEAPIPVIITAWIRVSRHVQRKWACVIPSRRFGSRSHRTGR